MTFCLKSLPDGPPVGLGVYPVGLTGLLVMEVSVTGMLVVAME